MLIGDALVHENERLQIRINQVLDRVEASFKQSLRIAIAQGSLRPNMTLPLMPTSCVVTRWDAGINSLKAVSSCYRWKTGSSSARC